MMKSILISLMALFLMVTNAFAVDFTLTTKTLSQYVGPNGIVLRDKPVQQTDLFVSLPKSFYADIWVSLSGKNDLGKEVDYTLGWSGEVSGLLLDAGVVYYDLIQLFQSRGDAVNFFGKVSREIAISKSVKLTPYAKAEVIMPTNRDYLEGGTLAYAGSSFNWNMPRGFSLNQEIYVLLDSGTYGVERAWISKYSAGIKKQLSKTVAVEPGLSIFVPLSKPTDRQKETLFSLSISKSF